MLLNYFVCMPPARSFVRFHYYKISDARDATTFHSHNQTKTKQQPANQQQKKYTTYTIYTKTKETKIKVVEEKYLQNATIANYGYR